MTHRIDNFAFTAQGSQAMVILLCSYYVIEYVCVYSTPVSIHFHFIGKTKPVFDSIFHHNVIL